MRRPRVQRRTLDRCPGDCPTCGSDALLTNPGTVRDPIVHVALRTCSEVFELPFGMDRLDAMLEDIRGFVADREWEPFHDPKNLAMAVASEAGELLSELRWIRGEDADAHCRDPEQRARVADEIADVAVTLFMLADRIGLDLPAAVHAKMKKNRVKYPIEESGE